MVSKHSGLALAFAGLLGCGGAQAETLAAEYLFNDTLAPTSGGAPALTSVDPLGLNAFETQTVFGSPRRVYHTDGSAFPTSDQAGLTLNTAGLLTSPSSYSVEMVFEFLGNANAWRRIVDVQNRQSDNGFYVDPANNLDIFPISGSSSPWANNVFHDVILTDAGGTLSAYLDGILQFNVVTPIMNLDFDPVNNPSQLMGFFLDNVVAGGQGEFSDARTALIRLYDGALDPGTVAAIGSNPFAPVPSGVPEPGEVALFGAGLLALSFFGLRKSR